MGPLKDRREDPKGDPEELQRHLQAGLELVRDDIEECLAAWSELDPALTGEVMIGFDVSPEGLTNAWIEEHSDVPAGPLSCFGSAVYEVDWSGITEEPVMITSSFEYRVHDEDQENE
ncbi:MAG: hypothetical protein KC636_29915 [Myxococcales bacterium]|nr:hypothetical protein [Myxococcales bacterium]